ncbi:hypothetical protein GCM10009860_17340 [Microbacterium mitrae]
MRPCPQERGDADLPKVPTESEGASPEESAPETTGGPEYAEPKIVKDPSDAAGPSGSQGTDDPLDGISREIHDEVDRMYREVPEIGLEWRWYDWPYRALELLFVKRKYWTMLPKAIRRTINRAQNWLRAHNSLEREKIAHLDDPMYNIVVPEHERVSLPCFWLVEYYSPSHAEVLMQRVRGRKWVNADFTHPGSPDVSIREGRKREGGLGWQTIATLVKPDHAGFYPGAIRTKFPEEFDSISLSLLPLGSALTAVVAQFRLSETASKAIDASLRTDHQPQLYRYKGTLQVRQRMFVALDAVKEKREELHQTGRDWFAEELPGLFAVEAKASHPTLDMLFTQRHDPFELDYLARNEANFQRALGLDQDPFSLLHAPEWKRIRIMEYQSETVDRVRQDSSLALIAKFDDALGRKKSFRNYGEQRTEGAILHELNFGAPGLITRFGLFELLRVKQEAVAIARDQASSLHSRRPVTSAKKLRRSVLRSSIDMATTAHDIENLTSNDYMYEWQVPTLATRERTDKGWSKSKDGVLKEWAKRQSKEARRLADLDRELLGILDLASSLTASIEGIRSQRWSLVVAFLSLVASGAAVWFAYMTVSITNMP